MNGELEVLRVVTQRLTQGGIPYMVTGSIAATFYAVPRMTRDIDIVVELQERDVDRLVKLFQDQFYVDGEMVRRAVRDQSMFNLIHTTYVIKNLHNLDRDYLGRWAGRLGVESLYREVGG